VSVHLTEEEQIENLKRWWKEYGKFVLAAIILGIAAYFGWNNWKDHQRVKAEKASATYEQLVNIINRDFGSALSETDRAMATQLATELKNNDKNLYAHTAAFFLAKIAVENNNLDQAVVELQWVLSANPDVATEQVARLRLARVLTAKQSYDDALAQLAREPSAAFAAEYAEVRGDIYKLKGELDKARSSYDAALAATNPQQQERYMLLQMKVDDLKLVDSFVTAEKAQ
jgi:predicted negative regulator of RcsB-dependent stress response